MKPRCLRSNDRAFTLIELLVVIGIIALIIAILLPILSKAKERARELKCAANLRTIGQGLTMYTQQYNRYPCYRGGLGAVIWPVRIRNILGGSQDVFYCPAQDPSFQWQVYHPGMSVSFAASEDDVAYGYKLGEQFLATTGVDPPFSYGYNAAGLCDLNILGHTGKGLGYTTRSSDHDFWFKGELPASHVQHPSEMIAIADGGISKNPGVGFLITPVPGFRNPAPVHRGGANVLFCDGHVEWFKPQDLVTSNINDTRLAKLWNNDQKPVGQ